MPVVHSENTLPLCAVMEMGGVGNRRSWNRRRIRGFSLTMPCTVMCICEHEVCDLYVPSYVVLDSSVQRNFFLIILEKHLTGLISGIYYIMQLEK